MAYSKQTWIDDDTTNGKVTATRMNHIEQGIYDNSLATDKINPSGAATTTAEIEEGQVNDVIGFKSLKLKGQTSQVSYNGYNILKGIIENKTTNGVTITKNEDNSYKLSGTATAVALFSTNINTTLEASKTYVIGFSNSNSNVQLSIRPSDGSTQYANTTTQKYVTYTPNENIDIRLFVRVANGATVNETIYPIIYVGNTEKSYEPYVGGKASPNPDFPQDINNVSGDNVIEISNINMLDESKLRQGAYIKATNNTRLFIDSNNYLEVGTYTVVTNLDLTKFRYGADVASTPFPLDVGKPIDIFDAGWITNSNHLTFSITQRGYLGVGISKTNASNNITPSEVADYWFMVYKGTYDSNITYQEHQGNNFEINLGKNLFNKDDSSLIFNGFTNGSSSKLEANANARTVCIPCKPNTTYTVSKILSARFYVADTSSSTISSGISITALASSASVANHTVTTSANAKYLLVFYYLSSADTLTEEEIRSSIQIEVGSQATSYADYFTPIYLGEIGTDCNDIRRYNGKWYWHKEIGKIAIDESYTWTRETSSSWVCPRFFCATLPDLGTTVNGTVFNNSISNMAKVGNTSDYTQNENVFLLRRVNNTNRIDCMFDLESVDDLKSILANENMLVYYGLITPIDEEITYAPLLRQLDELYNSGLYDVTNISQDNSSEAFVLDIEACKNNINGIVEYIRR